MLRLGSPMELPSGNGFFYPLLPQGILLADIQKAQQILKNSQGAMPIIAGDRSIINNSASLQIDPKISVSKSNLLVDSLRYPIPTDLLLSSVINQEMTGVETDSMRAIPNPMKTLALPTVSFDSQHSNAVSLPPLPVMTNLGPEVSGDARILEEIEFYKRFFQSQLKAAQFNKKPDPAMYEQMRPSPLNIPPLRSESVSSTSVESGSEHCQLTPDPPNPSLQPSTVPLFWETGSIDHPRPQSIINRGISRSTLPPRKRFSVPMLHEPGRATREMTFPRTMSDSKISNLKSTEAFHPFQKLITPHGSCSQTAQTPILKDSIGSALPKLNPSVLNSRKRARDLDFPPPTESTSLAMFRKKSRMEMSPHELKKMPAQNFDVSVSQITTTPTDAQQAALRGNVIMRASAPKNGDDVPPPLLSPQFTDVRDPQPPVKSNDDFEFTKTPSEDGISVLPASASIKRPNSGESVPLKIGQSKRKHILWKFILDQLAHRGKEEDIILKWENIDEGIFRILDHHELAARWNRLKNRSSRMTYDKLSRALRRYKKWNIMGSVPLRGRYGQRLVYQFRSGAVDWRGEWQKVDARARQRNSEVIIIDE